MAKYTGHTITSDSSLGAAEIERSLRFNDDGEPILTRTPSSAGNRKTWTYSCWVKKSRNDTYQGLLAVGTVDGSEDFFGFESSNRLYMRYDTGSDVKSSALFRDLNGWYHIVVVADTTQSQSSSTASDSRIRFYVNGEQLTDLHSDTSMPSQNFDFRINNNVLHYIGEYPRINSHLDGYLAEVNFVDGSALDASYFGFTDPQTGIWMPKRFDKSSIPNKKGRTFSSTWTASGNGFGGSNPITNAFDGDLSTSANNDGGGQILTWNTSTYNLRGELRIYCRSSSGVYDIYVNGNSGNTTKVGDTPSSNGWVDCGTFDHIKEIQFAGTTYNTGTGLGSAGVHILAITVDGTLLRNDMHEFGTNGFHLDFNDNSSTSALGKDTSGNGNDHATSNFSVSAGEGNDSLVDTPTNNFCTLNHLFMNGNEQQNHYNGNLNFQGDNNYGTSQATFPVTTGKWYWECEMSSQYVNIAGITRGTNCAENTYIGYDTNSHLFGFGYYYNDGTVKGTTDGLGTTSNNNLATSQTTAANGDILGIASDITNGYLIFYKNGTHIYTITGISNAFDWFPSFSAYGTSATWHVNFGQRPFSYTPPAGHKSLCSKNLSPNTPSVLRPQKHFDTVLYTGNGSTTQNISGLEFTPDFVWIKSRSSGSGHHSLMDSVRSGILGYDAALNSNQQIAEYSVDAFTINDNNSIDVPYYNNDYSMNTNSATYVAWCWKAGGAAVTNTVGNISAQVSANDEAGFSIITYTGDGNSSGNVGTGLRSTQPLGWAIVKRRDSTSDWQVGHSASGQGVNFAYHLNLNDASVLSGNSPYHMATQSATNGDRLYLAEGGLTSSATYVAYVWQERPGYSKFGSYTGNGNSNGTYVHLGFRPACIIIKNITTNTSWVIYDIKRSPTNVVDEVLFPNGTSVSGTTGDNEVDFLAKGFKYRAAANKVNSGSKDYVYMAFAEQPNPTPFDSFANAR